MRALFFTIGLVFIASHLPAQTKMNSGYIINLDGEKINCRILNKDWRYTPKKISVIIKGSRREYNPSDIKEFGISGHTVYISFNGNIDRSPVEMSRLTPDAKPRWSEEWLFLKQLVKGKGSLYQYTEPNIERFFFSTPSVELSQLVYKEYRPEYNMVRENAHFKQQLLNYAQCDDEALKVKYLKYNQKSLVKYFVKYNECIDDDFEELKIKKDRPRSVALSVVGGVDFGSCTMKNDVLGYDIDFGSKITPRIGINMEYTIPYQYGRWSVIAEANLRGYSATQEAGNQNAELRYQTLEIPLGFRYNLKLNDDLWFYVTAIGTANIYLKKEVQFERRPDVEINTTMFSYAASLGFRWKRINLEYRYYPGISLTNDYQYWISEYRSSSLMIGFRFY